MLTPSANTVSVIISVAVVGSPSEDFGAPVTFTIPSWDSKVQIGSDLLPFCLALYNSADHTWACEPNSILQMHSDTRRTSSNDIDATTSRTGQMGIMSMLLFLVVSFLMCS